MPFQFQNENGEPAGLIIDLWRLWSERTGIEIDFRAATWDETLRMVRKRGFYEARIFTAPVS